MDSGVIVSAIGEMRVVFAHSISVREVYVNRSVRIQIPGGVSKAVLIDDVGCVENLVPLVDRYIDSS